MDFCAARVVVWAVEHKGARPLRYIHSVGLVLGVGHAWARSPV